MTPDTHRNSAKLADQLMAIDVFSELLASTDPLQLGRKLTEQLRELTGARTVALVAHPEEGAPHALIHVSPERRAALFSPAELGLFCPECTLPPLPHLTAQLPPAHPLRVVLQRGNIESLLRVPLRTKDKIIACLLLLDLPEPSRIEETVTVIGHLAPVIALALKNAFAQQQIAQQALALQAQARELEHRVSERTAALAEANRSLATSRLAALNLMEDAVAARERAEQASNALQRSEALFRRTFDEAPVGAAIVALDQTFVRVNASLCHFLAYSEEELRGKSFTQIIHPDDVPSNAARVQRLLDGEASSFDFEYRFLRKDGATVWGRVSVALVRDGEGRPLHLAPIIQDVTQRKQAEEDLEQFFALVPDMVCIATGDGYFRKLNDEWVRVLGYSKEELMAVPFTEFVHPEDQAATRHETAQEAAGNFTANFINRYRAKDGTYRWFEWNSTSTNEKNVLFAAARDITKHRLAAEALRESEEKFAKVFHSAPAWIGITDLADATYLDINEEALRLSGFTREEVIGRTSAELGWLSAEFRADLARKVREHGRVSGLELTVHDKSGHPHIGWLSSELITIGGRPCLLTIIIDITERKRAEELIAWEAALVENSADVCAIKDLDLRIRAVNKAFLTSAGVATAGEVLGKNDIEIFQRPGNEANIAGFMADERRAQTLPPGEYISRLETMVRPDGTEQILLTRKFPVFNPAGQLIATANISSDVTEHQRLEEALHRNEQRYRQLFSSNVAGVALHEIICDAAGHPCDYRFLEVNPAYERITGLTAAALVGHTVLEVMPQTEPIWIERYGRVALTGDSAHFEHFSAALNRHFEVTAYCPQPGQFASMMLDITERRHAEEALRESEEKNRLLIRHLHAGVVVHAPNTEILLANEQASALLGLTIDQMLGKTAIDPAWGFVREDETPMPLAEFPVSRVLATRTPLRDQFLGINLPGAGARTWVLVNAFPNFDAKGELLQIVVTFIDITERKRAEDALRDSLREKEALLKEVHHRVKNNLQVISSLLRLESGRVTDVTTQSVLRDMQNRIRTMALLHESLYRAGNLAEVDMKAYLETLCQQLFRAASARSSGPVELQLAVAPMRLELNRTVPCGLIVNELVSNCLKHAFPGERGGRILVELQPTDVTDEWRLRVSDDGVGLPAGFTLENLPSLGLQLVSDLSRQLQGRLEIPPGPPTSAPDSETIPPRHGSAFSVYFKAVPPDPRPAP